MVLVTVRRKMVKRRRATGRRRRKMVKRKVVMVRKGRKSKKRWMERVNTPLKS